MKILITGGNGYLARNLKPLFEQSYCEVLTPSHTELDVTNLSLLQEYFNIHDPDFVIHAAVKGGKRGYKDTYENFVANITMFENLMSVIGNRPIVLFSSGAELDRRNPIFRIQEDEIYKAWPIDLYGLAKNIITRRVEEDYYNKRIYILRLFGCFNHNEDDGRFIQSAIKNIKQGLPIIIHQNKEMDFFYLDDIFTIINCFFHRTPVYGFHILNMVYHEKHTLLDVANMIVKHTSSLNPQIQINNLKIGNPYSGDGSKMSNVIWDNKQTIEKLIGLEEGIRRTCNKLL